MRPRSNGPDVWEFRWRVKVSPGKYRRKSAILGTIDEIPNESAAKKEAAGYRLLANPDHVHRNVMFGALIQRYVAEELPERKTTSTHYLPWLNNYITPKWQDYPIAAVKVLAVEQWLKGIQLAKHSKENIKSLMSVLFDCAMRWELVAVSENPMRLVRVKDDKPQRIVIRYTLTPEQIAAVLAELIEPYRTMACVAVCLGLRASEIAGLQWTDIEWQERALYVQRTFVLGDEDEVKTRRSKTRMPLCGQVAEILRDHQKRVDVCSPWIFSNPDTGKPRSMNYAQQEYLAPAGIAAGIGEGLGWHSFRHTYSTMLRQLKVDIKVQQEMVRHADVRLTLNRYTHAVPEAMHEAGEKVAGMALGQLIGR